MKGTSLTIAGGACAALLWLVAGCADTAGLATPTSLKIVAGDDQGALEGDTLPIALRIRVINSHNTGVGGIAVDWTVTSGSATVTPVTAATSADGEVTATIQLGPTAGPVTVQAAVAGLAPASFLLMNDACHYFAPVTLGQTTPGRLSNADCAFSDGTKIDFLNLTMTGATNVLVSMTASAYLPYLFLFDTTGTLVAGTIDNPIGPTSVMRVLLPAGHWSIGANAVQLIDRGAYTVKPESRALDVTNCELVWVVRGISAAQATSPAACPWNGGSSTAEHFVIIGDSGVAVTISATGTGFPATLNILDAGLTPLQTATAAANQPATISFTPLVTTLYVIEVAGFAGTQQYLLATH